MHAVFILYPEDYDGRFQIDLAQFADATAFIAYIQEQKAFPRSVEAMFVGLIAAMAVEL